MRAVLTLCLLLLLAPARAEELLVDMGVADDGRLLVSYTPPAGVSELQLWDRRPAALRVWRDMVVPLDDCASLVEGQRIRLHAGCTVARFAVRPRVLNLNAVYEAALPVGADSVMAYTSFYAAALSGQALHWRWHAPAGGYVVQQGRLVHADIEQVASAAEVDRMLSSGDRDSSVWEAVGASQYVYIGRSPVDSFPGGVLVHDPALDEARLAQIRKMLVATMETLGRAYGIVPAGPGAVIAATAQMPGFKGDTTGGDMMLLRLSRQRDGAPALNLPWYVAHEVTHWWNAGVFHSDPDRPWMHEGHAEFMALLMLHSLGLVDAARLQERLDWEINRCALLRGGKPALSLPSGRSADTYDCGMVLMMAAQLARADRRPAVTPIDELASLHRGRTATLSQEDFATWADGAAMGPMHRLLFDPGLGFDEGLQALMGKHVHVQPVERVPELPGWARDTLGTDLMSALMVKDCGSNDFYTLDDNFRVGDLAGLSCRHFKAEQLVEKLEGLPIRSQPVAAWIAMRTACMAGRGLQLRNHEGSGGTLDCPEPLPDLPIKAIWHLDPQALKLLGLSS